MNEKMLNEMIFEALNEKSNGFNDKELIKNTIPKQLKKILNSEQLHIYGRTAISNIESFVPWVAILNSDKSKTVQYYIYVVILFSKDGSKAVLSLNLGVTHLMNIKKEYLKRSITHKQFLNHCAEELRSLIEYPIDHYIIDELDLKIPKKSQSIGKFYQFSNILAKEYFLNKVPNSIEIERDIKNFLKIYDQLTTKIPDYNLFVDQMINRCSDAS